MTTEVLRDDASAAAKRTAAQVDAGETPSVDAFRQMLKETDVAKFTNYGGQRQIQALCNGTDHGRALIEELNNAATLLIE